MIKKEATRGAGRLLFCFLVGYNCGVEVLAIELFGRFAMNNVII